MKKTSNPPPRHQDTKETLFFEANKPKNLIFRGVPRFTFTSHFKLRTANLFVLMILALPAPSLAQQTTYTTAQISFPLNELGHSPRADALGSAFTAGEGEAACLYWNPAGLDGLVSPEISAFHESWLAGLNQETLVAALPLGRLGSLALGGNYLSRNR